MPISAATPAWSLILDEEDAAGMAVRPHLGLMNPIDREHELALATPLSELLEPLELDPLTVADDQSFLERLIDQPNLPEYVKRELPLLY